MSCDVDHFIPGGSLRGGGRDFEQLIIFVGSNHVLTRPDGSVFWELRENPESTAPLFFCGELNGRRIGASELPMDLELSETQERVEIRRILQDLSLAEYAALSRARELLSWHESHRFCGCCGAEMEFADDECAKICPACGRRFYPVIAPAVIVAIERDGKILLAHNRKFREGLFGLVAGFVESGESLEEAVRREVREEVGIEIGDLEYFSSQAWPFPNSLMTGFFARYQAGEIQVDGDEITEADWFTLDNLPVIPSRGSIARRLIDGFLDRYDGAKC